MNAVGPTKSLGQAALELQAIVVRARLAGKLGPLNDYLSVEKLAVLLESKLNAWGFPLSPTKAKALAEFFPPIDTDPDEPPGGREANARQETKHIETLLKGDFLDLVSTHQVGIDSPTASGNDISLR